METENTMMRSEPKKITADQVVWVKDILSRFESAIKISYPGISRLSQAAKVAAIIELMEILDMVLDGESAYRNLINIIIPQTKQTESVLYGVKKEE